MNNLTQWKWRSKLNDLEIIFLNKIHSTFSAEAKGAEYTLSSERHCCFKTLNYYLLYSVNCLTGDEPIGYIDCVWFQFCFVYKKSKLPMNIIRQNK